MKKSVIQFVAITLLLIMSPIISASAEKKSGSIQISAGYEQVGMLTDGGNLIMVGNNDYGLIGNGEPGDDRDDKQLLVLKPTIVMKDVDFISIQNYSSYAIKKDHTLWSWGFDHLDSLGNGDRVWNSAVPTMILKDVRFIATGHGLHMLAIKEDNTLWGWGDNTYGQLGLTVKKTQVAAPVKIMSDIKYAAVGYGSSAVIKEDNTLWLWGRNDSGELGNGKKVVTRKPFKLMDNVKTVTLGFHRSCALKKDGTVWTWGAGGEGDIGDGRSGGSTTPVKVMNDVISITTKAEGHILALKKDGSLWAWGNNEYGQLGDGTKINRFKPIKIMSDVKMVDSNYGYSIALKKDNTLWAWGDNTSGQLGFGDTKGRLKPTKVLDFDTITKDGSCVSLPIYLDGLLDEWDQTESIYRDDLTDSSSDVTDLEAVNAYMDQKYIYIAVKIKGKLPDIDVSFYPIGDKETIYTASYSSDRNFLRIYTDNWDNGKDSYSCNASQSTLEMKIPLSDIGNVKATSLWIEIYYEGDGYCDKSKEWIKVPIKKSSKYVYTQKQKDSNGFVIDGKIGDWGEIKPAVIDPADDNYGDCADLEDIYTLLTEDCFYVALKTNSEDPRLYFELDTNSDQKADYHFYYDSFNKLIQVYKNISGNKEKLIKNI